MAHTLWRKQDNLGGRWTSPDPYGGSMTTADPQSFNRYTYCNNDPVNKIDQLGLALSDIGVIQTGDGELASTLEENTRARTLNSRINYILLELYRGEVDFELSSQEEAPDMPSTISEDMKSYLKSVEGLKLKPYSNDGSAGGNCTVGYGHFIESGACSPAALKKYKDFTEADANALFETDLVEKGTSVVRANVKVNLNQHQFDALVSFAFRLGNTRFAESTTVSQINLKNYGEGGMQSCNGEGGEGQARESVP